MLLRSRQTELRWSEGQKTAGKDRETAKVEDVLSGEGASAGLPGILRNSSWPPPSAARLSAPASSFYSPACLKDKTGASDKYAAAA